MTTSAVLLVDLIISLGRGGGGGFIIILAMGWGSVGVD